MDQKIYTEKTENLIAIGATTAANCIPCFEHLYGKAVTSGIAAQEILRTIEIASQVKNGAHKVISRAVQKLTGPNETGSLSLGKAQGGCCC